MKPSNRFLTLLTSFVLTCSFVVPLDSTNAAEKWQQDMREDYAKVLQEKKKLEEHHRRLVRKWKEKGHLLNLIDLYEEDPHHSAP